MFPDILFMATYNFTVLKFDFLFSSDDEDKDKHGENKSDEDKHGENEAVELSNRYVKETDS